MTFPPKFSEFIHVIYFQFPSFCFYCVALCAHFSSVYHHPALGDVQLNECKQMAKKVGKTEEREKLKHVQVEAACLLTCFTFIFLLLTGMKEGCEDRENGVEIELG